MESQWRTHKATRQKKAPNKHKGKDKADLPIEWRDQNQSIKQASKQAIHKLSKQHMGTPAPFAAVPLQYRLGW